ncbi:MAG: SusC/RagA family TonB-linked outer membrane protein [Tannerellaceae bacterium]|jgi:TonB-linked SusC/RagA family outer membrane protein|nr:SusC/RagA family TonB-linked outer membrane protein [Tannerellaceae bacterium]
MVKLMVLFRNHKLFLSFFLVLFTLWIGIPSVFAQGSGSVTIKGRVVDERTNEAIIGANIIVKNGRTSSGTVTDANGNFSLNATLPVAIEVRYLGYKVQEIDIYERPSELLLIQLVENANILNEVVIVSDGYVSQERKLYTGASSILNSAVIGAKPAASPVVSLQGEVAGLNVNLSTSQPGGNIQVRLRGLGSLALNSNPLYVIDGMIVNSGDLSRLSTTSSALAGINQEDIEDVTVLKDAAATAIYGSRGSNGVIIITTKKGRAGKTQVTFDVETGITQSIPFPDAGQPLNAQQFSELFIEGLVNTGTYTDQEIADLADSYGFNTGRSNNWQEIIYRTGKQQQYNVSVRGGNENTKLFASAGYFSQEATTRGSDMRRVTGLINVDQKISERFSFSAGLNVSNVFQHAPDGGTGSWANPIFAGRILRPFQMAYNEDGTWNTNSSDPLGYTAHKNVLYLAEHDVRTLNTVKGLGNASLKWNIWDKLNYTSYVSIDYNNLEEYRYENPVLGDAMNVGGRVNQYYTRYFNWLTRNQLDYRYNYLGSEDVSNIAAVVGYEAQASSQLNLNGTGTGFPSKPTPPVLSNAAVITSAGSNTSEYAFVSFYSRLNANYKNRYSASASFRRDGSSVFGMNNRYGNFWSVGANWNLEQEAFFRDQTVLSSARLHTSYGTTGNAQGISNYAAKPLAAYGSNYTTGNGQNYSTIGNLDLTWEKQQKFDVGAELGFFDNRLLFVPDFYINNVVGLIQSLPLSRTTGFSSVSYANVGNMQNKGVEFSLKSENIRSKDFSWTSNFNIAFNRNQITDLAKSEGGANGNYYLEEGYDYYTYYVRLYAGANPDNGEALWYTDATKTETTNRYNDAERVPYKSASPKYYGGFSNTFEYKGIRLGVEIYFNIGNYVVDSWSTRFYDGEYFAFNKYQREYWKRWTTPGQVTDVPKYIYGGGSQAQSNDFSSRFLYDGSFIRLKNISLGYDLTKLARHFIPKVGKVSLLGRAGNLFTKTFDEKLPFDPESGNVTIPIYRTYSIALNVEL